MNRRKVLVDCAVLALQDSRLLYPCCKLCLSRSAEESASRSRCIKCGFTCDAQSLDYRYRLSLKVSRGRNIFGVTVFGGCLNSFFGITASHLQRFIDSEKQEGPHGLQQLLIKAVEDCFIGRSFVFGFKLYGLGAESCLLNEHTPSLSSGAESTQLVACQILSPNGASLGMTVFAYLQSILQASHSASQETDQSLQKDSLLNNSEYTLPLCVKSQSDASSLGLKQQWQPASDMGLCFSPEEASGLSLHRIKADDVKCIVSPNQATSGPKSEREWPVKKLCFLPDNEKDQEIRTPGVPYAENTLHIIGADTGHFSSIAKLHSPVPLISNPMGAVSSGYRPQRTVCNHCSLQEFPDSECKTSVFENSHVIRSGQNLSFGLEDAPLSESLGSFVSIESPISVAVGKHVPARKCAMFERNQITSKETDCPLTPLQNVINVITEKDSERSRKRTHQKRKILPLSKPHFSGTPTEGCVPKDSGLDCSNIKDTVSNSLTKNPVSKAFWLQCGQRGNSSKGTIIQAGHAICPEMQCQCMKEEESPVGGHQDEYNFSADLFCQSSMDITSQYVTERVVSDPKKRKKDCSSENISEREICTSLHFAPSLQSTPIAHPYHRCIYRQGHTHDRKSSGSPCSGKQTIHNNRVLGNHSRTTQQSEAGKPEKNQIQSSDFVNSDSGCASDMQKIVECDVSPTDTNEWSRDLFANSF